MSIEPNPAVVPLTTSTVGKIVGRKWQTMESPTEKIDKRKGDTSSFSNASSLLYVVGELKNSLAEFRSIQTNRSSLEQESSADSNQSNSPLLPFRIHPQTVATQPLTNCFQIPPARTYGSLTSAHVQLPEYESEFQVRPFSSLPRANSPNIILSAHRLQNWVNKCEQVLSEEKKKAEEEKKSEPRSYKATSPPLSLASHLVSSSDLPPSIISLCQLIMLEAKMSIEQFINNGRKQVGMNQEINSNDHGNLIRAIDRRVEPLAEESATENSQTRPESEAEPEEVACVRMISVPPPDNMTEESEIEEKEEEINMVTNYMPASDNKEEFQTHFSSPDGATAKTAASNSTTAYSTGESLNSSPIHILVTASSPPAENEKAEVEDDFADFSSGESFTYFHQEESLDSVPSLSVDDLNLSSSLPPPFEHGDTIPNHHSSISTSSSHSTLHSALHVSAPTPDQLHEELLLALYTDDIRKVTHSISEDEEPSRISGNGAAEFSRTSRLSAIQYESGNTGLAQHLTHSRIGTATTEFLNNSNSNKCNSGGEESSDALGALRKAPLLGIPSKGLHRRNRARGSPGSGWLTATREGTERARIRQNSGSSSRRGIQEKESGFSIGLHLLTQSNRKKKNRAINFTLERAAFPESIQQTSINNPTRNLPPELTININNDTSHTNGKGNSNNISISLSNNEATLNYNKNGPRETGAQGNWMSCLWCSSANSPQSKLPVRFLPKFSLSNLSPFPFPSPSPLASTAIKKASNNTQDKTEEKVTTTPSTSPSTLASWNAETSIAFTIEQEETSIDKYHNRGRSKISQVTATDPQNQISTTEESIEQSEELNKEKDGTDSTTRHIVVPSSSSSTPSLSLFLGSTPTWRGRHRRNGSSSFLDPRLATAAARLSQLRAIHHMHIGAENRFHHARISEEAKVIKQRHAAMVRARKVSGQQSPQELEDLKERNIQMTKMRAIDLAHYSQITAKSIARPLLSGYLSKRSLHHPAVWTRYLFILTQQHQLYYFNSVNKSTAQGMIQLPAPYPYQQQQNFDIAASVASPRLIRLSPTFNIRLEPLLSASLSSRFCFSVKSSTAYSFHTCSRMSCRRFYFACDNWSEMNDWVHILNQSSQTWQTIEEANQEIIQEQKIRRKKYGNKKKNDKKKLRIKSTNVKRKSREERQLRRSGSTSRVKNSNSSTREIIGPAEEEQFDRNPIAVLPPGSYEYPSECDLDITNYLVECVAVEKKDSTTSIEYCNKYPYPTTNTLLITRGKGDTTIGKEDGEYEEEKKENESESIEWFEMPSNLLQGLKSSTGIAAGSEASNGKEKEEEKKEVRFADSEELREIVQRTDTTDELEEDWEFRVNI